MLFKFFKFLLVFGPVHLEQDPQGTFAQDLQMQQALLSMIYEAFLNMAE